MKIDNDKYYTPVDLAKYCIDKAFEIIGEENVTEIIEPSAGNGSFSNQLDCIAYDLYPEGDNIIEQDYLMLDLEYKKGRLIIGNPPYGRVSNLAVSFYKKSIQIGDYIAFILPISQLDNNIKMYEFDFIYSEDLGIKNYSGKKVHCCFNIYRRPKNGILNPRPNYKLNDVEIREGRRGSSNRESKISKETFDYDIAICAWGCHCGKVIDYEGQYSTELYIKTHNEEYRQKVIDFIKDLKLGDTIKSTGGKKIQIWRMYRILKENIPGLK